uniref:Copia protein n=1 Tax=Tanacetum cinerariifolium TaxID=118510 RepID=A0A6L2JEN7_TANCI|nr:copia protein [Tanacetum cinerariifolium]
MMMKTRMKNPPLNQTRGQRDAEKVKSPNQQAVHQKLLPRALEGADDQPIVQSSQHPEWFSQPKKPPSPDRDWNKTLPAIHGSIQPWISKLGKQADTRSSFNKLMDTPLDFSNFIMIRLRVDTLTPELLAGPTYDLVKGSCKSLIELEYHLEEVYKAITDQLDWVNPEAFMMNRLKVDTLTLELLAGPTYKLMKGSCKSLVELEFFLEEVYKATTDQLDWINPEGHQYPHTLLKPLPLIPNSQGHRVISFDHFINNDLEYLHKGSSSRKYTTSITKTKAADYGHIKWIEDLVWGRKRQQFYGFTVNRESAHDVYSKRRIMDVTELKIVDWHNYKHLDWITVHRDDEKLYKFKEGDFKRLRIQDIKDILLLLNKDKHNMLMRIDKLHKFSNGTLNDVRTALDDRLKELEYHLEEVYKAITDQLDWVNPEGQQYPHNLLQPLPLITDNRGPRVIPFVHFINNDLEYLRGGASSRKYTTSVTKTKTADYGHIKWIEDLVPTTMWIQEPIDYDKHALWGRRIIAVTELKIVEWHSYKHLDWITVCRKLTNLTVEEPFAFNVSLRMFTRSIVIQQRVEDLQLDEEEAIKVTEKKYLENDIVDETLEIDEIVNIKESRNHPLENMSMMGELNFFFGLQIKQMEDGIFFNQSKYIKEMLKKFGLEDSKPMKTPISSDTKLIKDEDCELVDSTKYQGMIGTTQLWLWYPKVTDIETIVYANYDHARDYVDRKSTSGICTFMSCCLISWFSKKQPALAISTTEVKYISARKACQQALWMKQALIDYAIRLDDVPIICDNKGAIDLSKNPVQHSRTKHIEIRHHFLRDNVQKVHFSIEKVSSVDNITDILTKPLKRELFNYLSLGLGMMEHIP